MMKRNVALLGTMLAMISTFVLASCGDDSVSKTEKTENIVNVTDDNNQKTVNATDDNNQKPETETKQKYVVELNVDNFEKYIDVRVLPVGTGSSSYYIVYFQGSLTYAYYDNVIVTSHYSRTGREGYDTEIALSTGGYARWYSTGGNGEYTVTAVSGKVIYWI